MGLKVHVQATVGIAIPWQRPNPRARQKTSSEGRAPRQSKNTPS